MRSTASRYQFYKTADECADAAAPLFAERGWEWYGVGVPTRDAIIDALRRLERWITSDKKSLNNFAETGRLAYYCGEFGHQGREVE